MLQNNIDLHCHLDLYPDYISAMKKAEQESLFTLAVTTTPRAWPRNKELTSAMQHVRPALGLHPQLVSERSGEIEIWEQYLNEARFIGEVGLDGSSNYRASLNKQIEVFERILECSAEIGNRVLSVHTLRAVTQSLNLIEKKLPLGKGNIILHWFTGSKSEALRALKLGCYFSINSQLLFTKSGSELLSVIPLEKILTETDGPFAKNSSFTPFGELEKTVTLIAKIKHLSPATVQNNIIKNLNDLLNRSVT